MENVILILNSLKSILFEFKKKFLFYLKSLDKETDEEFLLIDRPESLKFDEEKRQRFLNLANDIKSKTSREELIKRMRYITLNYKSQKTYDCFTLNQSEKFLDFSL